MFTVVFTKNTRRILIKGGECLDRDRQIKRLYGIILAVLGIVVFWAAVKYLLPWAMPIVIAFALAWMLEPMVSWGTCRLGLPRGLVSAVLTMLLIGGIVFILTAIIGSGLKEIKLLLQQVPELLESLTGCLKYAEALLYRLHETMPAVSGFLISSVKSLPSQASEIITAVSSRLISGLSYIASKTPSILFFLVTCSIGVYFISVEYKEIAEFIKRQIPKSWESRAAAVKSELGRTVSSWFWAQLLLEAITFGELTVAFLLLRIDYAVILALIISLLDVLPVIGTGTVLIPWALYSLAKGSGVMGAGLILTYLVITLANRILETKLVGKSIGLGSAAMLISAYIGYCMLGTSGLIAAPIVVIILKQLNDKGVIWLWK